MTDHPSPSEALTLVEEIMFMVNDGDDSQPLADYLPVEWVERANRAMVLAARSSEPPASPAPDLDPLEVQEAGMCPNCVTPWKCNGPHIASPAPDDEHMEVPGTGRCKCGAKWFASPAPASPDEPSTAVECMPDTEAGRQWVMDQFRGNPYKWTSNESLQQMVDRISAIEREARAASASVPPPLDEAIRLLRTGEAELLSDGELAAFLAYATAEQIRRSPAGSVSSVRPPLDVERLEDAFMRVTGDHRGLKQATWQRIAAAYAAETPEQLASREADPS